MTGQGAATHVSQGLSEPGLDTSNGLEFVQQRIGLFAKVITLISLPFLVVEQPLEIDLDELTRCAAHEFTAVLECFGNPLEPEVPARRVGNVTWRGVPFADLLARARVRPEATTVWLEGLDSGTFANVRVANYVKDIPLTRARQRDVLIAYAMNGQPLTPEHGFPVRAFVPGYFGTNSVKWLSRITLAATRPEGLFTTRLYNRPGLTDGSMQPARELDVQSVIVRPDHQDHIAPGHYVITGWAWSASPIVRVEVSTDRSTSWRPAHLEEPRTTLTWQRFSMGWDVTTPGLYEIGCRATDSLGRTQPLAGRNRIHERTVEVR
jgi:sulfane dehydrogenase subunit SoxC